MVARAAARTRLLWACILVFIYALAPAAHVLLDHDPASKGGCCSATVACDERPHPPRGHNDERNHDENGCAVCAILGFKYLTVYSQPVRALTICAGAPRERTEQVAGLDATRNTPIRGPPVRHVI